MTVSYICFLSIKSIIFRATENLFYILFRLYGYRLFSEEIFNEYAAQTMFFQSQAFPTEKNPEKARFCLAFFEFQKKPKVFKKSQNFKIWLQKSQIGDTALKRYGYWSLKMIKMEVKRAYRLSRIDFSVSGVLSLLPVDGAG